MRYVNNKQKKKNLLPPFNKMLKCKLTINELLIWRNKIGKKNRKDAAVK